MVAEECSVLEPFALVILFNHVGILKVTWHWAMRMLSSLQSSTEVSFLRGILDDEDQERFQNNEPLIHHWDPETKQFMQWNHCGSLTAKEFWTNTLIGKTTAMVL